MTWDVSGVHVWMQPKGAEIGARARMRVRARARIRARVRDEALAAEGLDAREQVSRRLGVLAPRRLHDVDAHRVGGHATRLVRVRVRG